MVRLGRARRLIRHGAVATMVVVAGVLVGILPFSPANAHGTATAAIYQQFVTESDFKVLTFDIVNDNPYPITEWRVDFDTPPNQWPAWGMLTDFSMTVTPIDAGGFHVQFRNNDTDPRTISPGSRLHFQMLMWSDLPIENCVLNGTTPCLEAMP